MFWNLISAKCPKTEFIRQENVSSDGIILHIYGPQTLETCLALSRRYPNCMVFKMKWLGQNQHSGMCELMDKSPMDHYITTEGSSLFGK